MYSNGSKLPFNEDVFMDTILCCAENCPDECCTDASVDNYFWVSYKHNMFNNEQRNKFNDAEDIDNIDDNIATTQYNNDIDYIVDMIYESVEYTFGKNIASAWLLHVCDGYSILELEQMGFDTQNITNEFRKIKKYVENISQNNDLLHTMLTDNNFTVKKK